MLHRSKDTVKESYAKLYISVSLYIIITEYQHLLEIMFEKGLCKFSKGPGKLINNVLYAQ